VREVGTNLEPLNDFELPDRIGAPSGPRFERRRDPAFYPEEQLTDAACSPPNLNRARASRHRSIMAEKAPGTETAPRVAASTHSALPSDSL